MPCPGHLALQIVIGSRYTAALLKPSTSTLDIAPSFEAMGLRLDTMMDEFYLTEAKSPSELQKQIRKSMLGS